MDIKFTPKGTAASPFMRPGVFNKNDIRGVHQSSKDRFRESTELVDMDAAQKLNAKVDTDAQPEEDSKVPKFEGRAFTPKVKAVFAIVINLSIAYWMMYPFFPAFLKEKGINKVYFGINKTIFSGAMIFAGWLAGAVLPACISPGTGIVIGSLLSITFLIGMGSLYFSNDNNFIIPMAMFFQVLGGLGTGNNECMLMAVLSSYKARREDYLGYYEVIFAVGTCFGPLTGAILYSIGHYPFPFYFFAAIYLVMVIVFACMGPNKIDPEQEGSPEQNAIEEAENALKTSSEIRDQEDRVIVTICQVASSAKVVFGFLCTFVMFFNNAWVIPLLSTHFTFDCGFTPKFFGIFLTFSSIFLILSMPISKLYPAWATKKMIVYFGLVVCSAGLVFVSIPTFGGLAPEEKVATNPKYIRAQSLKRAFSLIGSVCFGFGFGNISIKIMAEILEAVDDNLEAQAIRPHQEAMYNQISGYFTVLKGLGEMAGPFISSMINTNLTFGQTQMYLIVFNIVFTLFYIIFCRFN